MFDFKDIISVTLILFAVIDIMGSIPIIIDLRRREGVIQSEKATLVSGVLMIVIGQLLIRSGQRASERHSEVVAS